MKRFMIAFLKALAYLALYFGIQILVSIVYAIAKVVPIAVRYAVEGADLADAEVFQHYMDEVMQVVADSSMPTVIISGLLTLGVLWLVFVCRKKKFTKEVCLRRFHPGVILPVVLMGLSLNPVTGLLLSFLPEEWMSAYDASSSMIVSDNIPLMILGTAIMAPLVEEVIFRGLAFTRMKKGMPVIVAMLLSSALFGVAHGQPVWMAYAFGLGMLLVWVFERTKSLCANILLHLSYNLCAVLQLLIPEDAPEWAGWALTIGSVVVAAGSIFWFTRIPKATEPAAAEVVGTAKEITEDL